MIYLDNAASTKINNKSAKIIIDTYMEYFANSSSTHFLGVKAEKILNKSRTVFSKIIEANAKNIVFTSGGTESNNIGILGQIDINDKKQEIITTEIEHNSIYEVCRNLAENDINIKYVKLNENGKIDMDDLEKKISVNTTLAAFSMVNNEVGIMEEVGFIAEKIKKINSRTGIHIDAVQALGKINISLKNTMIDTMSFSSHKIYGPKGVGALYVKNLRKIKPVFFGGSQEFGLRPGTENLPGIAGFVHAAEIINDNISSEYDRMLEINSLYRELISRNIKDVIINTPEKGFSPYILNVSFKDILGEVLLRYLENDEIYVATGAACSSAISMKSNRISKLINGNRGFYDGTVRLSFGSDNNINEVNYVVERIAQYVHEIRKIRKGK